MRGFTPFSIRLAPATRANLEAIQREWSARSGEKITLAQVVDRLLEGPAARGDLSIEMEELNSDPQRTIRQINEKLAARLPYRRSEWLFIAEQILEDTNGISSHEVIFDPALWSVLYDALICMAGLFPGDSPVLRYIASKALSRDVSRSGEFSSEFVQEALATEKASFLSQPSPGKNQYLARALHVALRDGGLASDDTSEITDEGIERALSEVKDQLTKLAVRAVVDGTQAPLLGTFINSAQRPFHFTSELVSISARVNEVGDISCNLLLGNPDVRLSLPLNGFGQISDLHECLAPVGLSKTRRTKIFEVRTAYMEGEDTYLLVDGATRVWMTDNCIHQLRAGLAELLTFDDWAALLAQLRDAYGR